ncbi:hypothetical protein GF343_05250 [Candidatus Woesearchaeota archaeon]|nr:hypothetical protein [Candidatus Woesearchaeota archaeon]
MGLFNRVKQAWQIWKEVVEERKAREKAEKESKDLFQKVLAQRDRIEKLKSYAEQDTFEEIGESLAGILENNVGLPQEEQFFPEQVKNFFYNIGKKKVSVVYEEHGVEPANLAFIVHNAAKSQERCLGENLDGRWFLEVVHRQLFSDAKKRIRNITGQPGTVDSAYSTAQNAEKILECTNYTPDEKQEKIIEINALLAGALLPNLKGLSFQGLVAEFEDACAKSYEAMDKAQTPAELQEKAKGRIDIYKGRCYNNHFKNHANAFALGVISLVELEKIAKEHNRVFAKLDISKKDIDKNRLHPVARLNSNAYRIAINQLLPAIDPAARNGNPVLPEKEAKDIAEKVQQYAGLAELKPSEKKGTNHALKRVSRFYGWDNGQKPWEQKSSGRNGRHNYKNPLYDKRTAIAKKRR